MTLPGVYGPLNCRMCGGMGEVRLARVDGKAHWFPRRYIPCPRCLVVLLKGEMS